MTKKSIDFIETMDIDSKERNLTTEKILLQVESRLKEEFPDKQFVLKNENEKFIFMETNDKGVSHQKNFIKYDAKQQILSKGKNFRIKRDGILVELIVYEIATEFGLRRALGALGSTFFESQLHFVENNQLPKEIDPLSYLYQKRVEIIRHLDSYPEFSYSVKESGNKMDFSYQETSFELSYLFDANRIVFYVDFQVYAAKSLFYKSWNKKPDPDSFAEFSLAYDETSSLGSEIKKAVEKQILKNLFSSKSFQEAPALENKFKKILPHYYSNDEFQKLMNEFYDFILPELGFTSGAEIEKLFLEQEITKTKKYILLGDKKLSVTRPKTDNCKEFKYHTWTLYLY